MPFLDETNLIVYKQAFDENELPEILELFSNSEIQHNTFATISTGLRTREECLANSFIVNRLKTILRDYYGEITVGPTLRLYRQTCGSIKPHKDGYIYGGYQYTCLIYISDNFDGGNLSLKVKRSDNELAETDTHLKHKVFTLIPKSGYCVVFNKQIIHYASNVLDGCKEILLVDILVD